MTPYVKGPITLHCGDYRDVLRDVEPDAVITDPPYSGETHGRHDHAVRASRVRPVDAAKYGSSERRTIGYAHWTEGDVRAFVERWSGVDGWVVPLSSDDMRPWYRDAFEAAGRYATHQIPCCIRGMTVRLCGDGPSSWAVYAQPSRPRWNTPWGTLDGFYVGPAEKVEVVGGKPLWLMRALIRDYSRPGDLVCDPCAGGATTLIAAGGTAGDRRGAGPGDVRQGVRAHRANGVDAAVAVHRDASHGAGGAGPVTVKQWARRRAYGAALDGDMSELLSWLRLWLTAPADPFLYWQWVTA